MMCHVIGSEPLSTQFFRENVHCVEEKFKKLSFYPCISAITGGTEALLGLVSLVSAAAMLVFYKARMYMPVPAIRKTIWKKTEEGSQVVELVRDSAKVIAMGLLKSVPGIGNASAYWIYMLQDQNRIAITKLEKSQSQASIENKNFEILKGQLEKAVVQKDVDLKAKDTELETTTKELADKASKVTDLEKEHKTKTFELEELRKKLSKAKAGISELEKEIIEKDGSIVRMNGSLDELNKGIALLRKRSIENEERLAKEIKKLKNENGELENELGRIKDLNEKLSFAAAVISEDKKRSSHTEVEREGIVDKSTATKKPERNFRVHKKN
jgi:hypothetical protein